MTDHDPSMQSKAMMLLTRITARKPTRLSKKFSLVGDKLIKEGGGNLTEGIAERLAVDLEKFAQLLPTLTPKQATCYGVNGHDCARVVAKDVLEKVRAIGGDLPMIARTRDDFHWPDGPGLMMLDHDPPPDGPPLNCDALLAALEKVNPALRQVPALWRPSASSCIYKGDQALRGIAGQRLYIPVTEATDIPRSLHVLFARLLLAGFGHCQLSKSGGFLIRTLFDASVGQPERLDFCGGAECGPGLVQKLPPPILIHPDAPYLDTRAVLPDLTPEERETLETINHALKAPLREEQQRVRATWVATRVQEQLEKLPEPARPSARPKLETTYRQAAEGGSLGLDFELVVVEKGKTTRKRLTVRQLLANHYRYHAATSLDPLEPDYPQGQARLVGWLNLNAKRPYLQSQAHGGARYFLGEESATHAPRAEDSAGASVLRDKTVNDQESDYEPSDPSDSSVSITYSIIPSVQSVISIRWPWDLGMVDESGRWVLVESVAAAKLVNILKGRFAFCRKSLRWYAFIGTHWQALVTSLVDEVVTELLYVGVPHGFKARTLTAILTLLTKGRLPLPEVAMADSRWIPFTNGLLDPATGILVPITSDNALTWCLPYAYDPDADCPTIKTWLRQVVDRDDKTVELLRAWLAALLTGRADLQKFLHLLGPGGTGKGVFIRLAQALVGILNATITDLRNLETNRFETAALYGKRLVAITDSGRYGGSIDVFKALIGQDPLRLERKHQQQGATFTFQGLVLIASNEPLQTTDYTSAVERRRLTVEFNRRVTHEERAVWDAQGGEAAVLHREIPGIVNWVLQLNREDVTRLIMERPQRIALANQEAMCHSNPVADWVIQRTWPDIAGILRIGVAKEIQHAEKCSNETTITRKEFEKADQWAYPNYRTWCLEQHRPSVSLRDFSSRVLDIAQILDTKAFKGRDDLGAYIKGLRLRRYDLNGIALDLGNPWNAAGSPHSTDGSTSNPSANKDLN